MEGKMFDLAIDLLQAQMDGYRKSFANDGDEFRAAIRVLEAAANITDGDINRAVHGYVDPPVIALLEAIDAALLDALKEEK